MEEFYAEGDQVGQMSWVVFFWYPNWLALGRILVGNEGIEALLYMVVMGIHSLIPY